MRWIGVIPAKRNGNEGISKLEALNHDFAGYWFRRITDQHRLFTRSPVVRFASRLAALTPGSPRLWRAESSKSDSSWWAQSRSLFSRTRVRYSWTDRMLTPPSPTAEAMRLTEPCRTSPAANTPGTLVWNVP